MPKHSKHRAGCDCLIGLDPTEDGSEAVCAEPCNYTNGHCAYIMFPLCDYWTADGEKYAEPCIVLRKKCVTHAPGHGPQWVSKWILSGSDSAGFTDAPLLQLRNCDAILDNVEIGAGECNACPNVDCFDLAVTALSYGSSVCGAAINCAGDDTSPPYTVRLVRGRDSEGTRNPCFFEGAKRHDTPTLNPWDFCVTPFTLIILGPNSALLGFGFNLGFFGDLLCVFVDVPYFTCDGAAEFTATHPVTGASITATLTPVACDPEDGFTLRPTITGWVGECCAWEAAFSEHDCVQPEVEYNGYPVTECFTKWDLEHNTDTCKATITCTTRDGRTIVLEKANWDRNSEQTFRVVSRDAGLEGFPECVCVKPFDTGYESANCLYQEDKQCQCCHDFNCKFPFFVQICEEPETEVDLGLIDNVDGLPGVEERDWVCKPYWGTYSLGDNACDGFDQLGFLVWCDGTENGWHVDVYCHIIDGDWVFQEDAITSATCECDGMHITFEFLAECVCCEEGCADCTEFDECCDEPLRGLTTLNMTVTTYTTATGTPCTTDPPGECDSPCVESTTLTWDGGLSAWIPAGLTCGYGIGFACTKSGTDCIGTVVAGVNREFPCAASPASACIQSCEPFRFETTMQTDLAVPCRFVHVLIEE